MPVISTSIATLIQGVSQQPDSMRIPSQCELMDNAFPSVVKGVRKRAPFRHLAQLYSSPSYAQAFLHTINRDETERYTVVITNGNLEVFDMTGVKKTVNFPNGTTYLSSSNPSSGFAAVTVADYTFIANKNVTCAMGTAVSATPVHQGLFYVRQGGYGISYNVYVNGTGAGYTTSTTSATDIDTANIAGHLAGTLATNLGSNFSVTQVGSCIVVKSTNGADFTMSSTDGLNNQGVVTVKDTVQLFSSLPTFCPDQFLVKIVGGASQEYDGYYVKFVNPAGTSNGGTWQECIGPGVLTGFDPTTMPYQLVREADGTFTFQQADWTIRQVGDETSAPQPSFIGQTINDVFFHRGRLGLCSGQNVIFSKSSAFFDFWPDTVTQVLDSDRIDISINHVKVSIIRAAVPYRDALLLFSDQTQFILSASQLLSPKSVTVQPVVEYENDSLTAHPVYTGNSVYFTIPRGSYTGMRELMTSDITGVVNAEEVSAHVPQYVPGGVFKIASSSNLEMIALVSNQAPNQLFLYSYFWAGDRKEQSAWYSWTLDPGDTILNIDFIQTDLYMVVQCSDGVYLEVAHCELGYQDVGFTFQVNLDRLVYLTGSYNSSTQKTTWTLPYQAAAGVYQVVLGPAFTSPNETGMVPQTTVSGNTISAPGNWTAGPCYIGRKYTTRYRFSHIVMREFNRTEMRGVEAVQEGRLQLNRMSVTYENSGYFRAEVTPLARDLFSYQFTGYYTGYASTLVGGRPTLTGIFRFPVLSEARTVQVDLVNDTYLPSSWQNAGWEAKYYIRSNRV